MSIVRTPTFALSTVGFLLGALSLAGYDWATKPAIVCLATPGVGGMAIALYRHVTASGERWVWEGIVRAFRQPLTDEEKSAVLGHLPQSLLALVLLLRRLRSGK